MLYSSYVRYVPLRVLLICFLLVTNIVSPIPSIPVPLTYANAARPPLWITDNDVLALTTANNRLYLGGTFTYVGPPTGSFVGIDISSGVYDSDMPVFTGDVYTAIDDGKGGWFVGGNFTAVNGISRARIAHIKADKSLDLNWKVDANLAVYTLALSADSTTLYAGGAFFTITTSTASVVRGRLAALNTTTGAVLDWNPNVSDNVSTIVINDNTLYVGGYFSTIGGQARFSLAAVDATSGSILPWDPMIPNSRVDKLIVHNDIVYIGGEFQTVGGQERNNLAAVDKITAAVLPWNPNANSRVYALAISENTAYIGGQYLSQVGGQNRSHLASVDLGTGAVTSWNPNPDSDVYSLAVNGNTVYVGGEFNNIGGVKRRRLAAINAAGEALAWNPMVSDRVSMLAVSNDKKTVYAGGLFDSVNGKSRNRLAALDIKVGSATYGAASDWNPNANSYVSALATSPSGDIIYAGGYFDQISGSYRSHLAALDSDKGQVTNWNPAPNNNVFSILTSDDKVYIGGIFNVVGGQPRPLLAAIQATTGTVLAWNPNIDAGAELRTLVISGSTLYAGGRFTSVNGVTRNNAAAFDTETGALRAWDPNVNNEVNTLALHSEHVYIGGWFDEVGGKPRARLASVDATSGVVSDWNPTITLNVVGTINDLAIADGQLYTVGGFNKVGDLPRSDLVAFDLETNTPTAWRPSVGDTYGGVGIHKVQISDTIIYLGGSFVSVNDLPATNLAALPLRTNGPTVAMNGNHTILENTHTDPITISLTDQDTPAENLFVNVTSSNTALVPNANLVLSGTGATRTLIATPIANQQGSTTIVLSASDGVSTGQASFTLIVSPPPWLVMLYLAGDDARDIDASITPPMIDLLSRLDKMPFNPAMRLVVLQDFNQYGDSRVYVSQPTGLTDVTERLLDPASTWIGFPASRELDTGSATTLRTFVHWAYVTYPGSTHTMLSIVDHGGGWAPDFADPPSQPHGKPRVQAGGWRGMSMDLTSGASLATRTTREALQDVLASDQRVDVLFFDACLMGMVESAYEVRNTADYLVAGENLLYASFPYQDYLAPTVLTPTTTPRELAIQIVSRYNATDHSRNPFTIGAIDLRQLRGEDTLAKRVNNLATQLLNNLPPSPVALDHPLRVALTTVYSATQKFDYDASLTLDPREGYVDLADFAQHLRDTPDVAVTTAMRQDADAVVQAITGQMTERVVIATRAISGTYQGQVWNFAGARGLSIFLPLGEQDYRPTQLTSDGQHVRAERQMTYYTDATQLDFTRAVPQWAALLERLEANTPIRAPGGLLITQHVQEVIDQRPFTTPFPLKPIRDVYLPLITE